MVYKSDVDYEEVLNAVKDELLDSEEYTVDDIEVKRQDDNDLLLTGKVLIDDYLFTLYAEYIFVDDNTVERELSVTYDDSANYELTDDQITILEDFMLYVKNLMEI